MAGDELQYQRLDGGILAGVCAAFALPVAEQLQHGQASGIRRQRQQPATNGQLTRQRQQGEAISGAPFQVVAGLVLAAQQGEGLG